MPVDGVGWEIATTDSPATISGELLFSGGVGAPSVTGFLILTPRGPLPAGSYPVLVRDARVQTAVAAVHGEVTSQEPWLDLDGEGIVIPGYEAVLAYRYVSGKEPTRP